MRLNPVTLSKPKLSGKSSQLTRDDTAPERDQNPAGAVKQHNWPVIRAYCVVFFFFVVVVALAGAGSLP
jgi:hypothetical protein